MKQYRICLTLNNQWTAWVDLSVPFPAGVVHPSDILTIQFSAELTVPETVQFWLDHRLT